MVRTVPFPMKSLIALAFLAHPLLASPQQQAHSLLPKVKVGDAFTYSFTSKNVAGGREGSMAAKYVMTIASFEPKGTITFKNEQKEGTYKFGEQTTPLPDSVTTTRFKLNGEMLSSDPPLASVEQARVSQLMWMVVPTDPAKIGDKWTWEAPANEANGNVSVKGEGVCLTFEKHGGLDCAKLKLSAKETRGSKPASSSMEVWYAIKDGMPVEIRMDVEDAPLAPGLMGSIHAVNVRTKS